jgi:menaquinone-9 beta-reductase
MPNQADVVDALVVGGGPAGAAFALEAAASGKKVLLLEKELKPGTKKVCGGVLSPRCARALKRLGLWEKVTRLPHHELRQIHVEIARGPSEVIPFPEPVEFPCIVVNRGELDSTLWQSSLEAGANALNGVTVSSLQRCQEFWNVVISGGNPAGPVHVSARYLIAADGRNSSLANRLGFRTHGRSKSVCFQLRLCTHSFDPHGVHFFLFEDGYCGLSVDGAGTAHCDLISLRGGENLERLKDRLFAAQGEFPEKIRSSEFVQEKIETRSPIGEGFRRKSDIPTFRMIGDAQRWVEPFTGEGIVLALETAGYIYSELFGHTGVPIRNGLGYPEPSLTNQVTSFVIGRPGCARALLHGIRFFPRMARFFVAEVLK